jgi:hypothetical protein
MGPVESAMFANVRRRLEEGALSVTGAEVMDAVIPSGNPELRERPAYRYGLERLRRRHVINAVVDQAGTLHYFIGAYPSDALFKSIMLEPTGGERGNLSCIGDIPQYVKNFFWFKG